MVVRQVAAVHWADVDGRSNQSWTRGKVRANEMVPRGPGMGSHVAPSQHFIWKVPKFLGSMGFEPTTTHQAQALSQMTQHQCAHVLLVKSNVFKFI
jgi:hypothetical protein